MYVTGTQLWAEGSQYSGQFENDLRHGTGEHAWANKEVSYPHMNTPDKSFFMVKFFVVFFLF